MNKMVFGQMGIKIDLEKNLNERSLILCKDTRILSVSIKLDKNVPILLVNYIYPEKYALSNKLSQAIHLMICKCQNTFDLGEHEFVDSFIAYENTYAVFSKDIIEEE